MKYFRQNLFYLIAAFFSALVLFFYATMSNFQNTVANRVANSETFTNTIYDVPIILNYDSEKYFISGFSSFVSVQMTSANRLTIQKESRETTRTFTVSADFNGLETGTHVIPLKVDNLPSGVTATAMPNTITVKIGKRVNKTVPVETLVDSQQLAEGLSFSSIETADTEVTVTSDEETIKQINRVVAILPSDVIITENFTGVVSLLAVDKNGNVLPAVVTPIETELTIKVKKN